MSRSRRRAFGIALGFVATIALPLGFWWLMHWLDATTLEVGIAPLADAEFIASPDTSPPAAAAGWERHRIPDDWRASTPEVVEGWYRLSFHADVSDNDDWSVYLPVVHMNAAAWVNGRFVGDGGRFDEPVARNWNRPLLFAIPSNLVVAGRNTLYVRLKADRAGRGLLGPVYVAPRRLLLAAHAHRRLFTVQFLRATAVCQVVVFLFVAALGLQRPNDTVYRWAALAGFAWSLTWPFVLVVDTRVSTTAWYWLFYTAAGWFTLLAAGFVLAFLGESSPRTNRWIVGYGMVGSATLAGLAAFDSSLFHAAAVWAWLPLAFLAPAYSTARFLAALARDPANLEYQINYAAGISIFGCGLHDWMVMAGGFPALESFYSPYPAPLAQLAIGIMLVRRFAGALTFSEALVESLEEKVLQKRAELQLGYERIREMDRSRVLSDERQRIMRDVQDGLGSHLVSTLALTERADVDRRVIVGVIRSALDDLRLMIDSLGPVEGDVLPVLGQLRARLQPRLDAAGIRIEWRVEGVTPIPDLGPHRVLQILRVLHEAIVDILQRPHARTMTVRTGEATAPGERPAIFVEVSGDGEPRSDGSGHAPARARMYARAAEIGALLESEASPVWVRHRLWLPFSGVGG
jgi:signal transduction histidine kinase